MHVARFKNYRSEVLQEARRLNERFLGAAARPAEGVMARLQNEKQLRASCRVCALAAGVELAPRPSLDIFGVARLF